MKRPKNPQRNEVKDLIVYAMLPSVVLILIMWLVFRGCFG